MEYYSPWCPIDMCGNDLAADCSLYYNCIANEGMSSSNTECDIAKFDSRILSSTPSGLKYTIPYTIQRKVLEQTTTTLLTATTTTTDKPTTTTQTSTAIDTSTSTMTSVYNLNLQEQEFCDVMNIFVDEILPISLPPFVASLTNAPINWKSRESFILQHQLDPQDSGSWHTISPSFQNILLLFQSANDNSAKITLLVNLITENSWSFISLAHPKVVSISKQVFKKNGVMEHTRINQEGVVMKRRGNEMSDRRLQSRFMWKDGVIMVGDSTSAMTIWTFISGMAGTLLLFERAFFKIKNMKEMQKKRKQELYLK